MTTPEGGPPRIFVSIAAYRDPELVPTLRDLFAKAAVPDAIRVAVCDQYGPEAPELPTDLASDPRIVRLAVPWQQSRGACWARSLLMQQHAGEDFFLQLDSHHRFVAGWDRILLEQWEATDHPKAILSTYVAGYVPAEPRPEDAPAQELHLDAFHDDGIAVFIGVPMDPDVMAAGRPTRGRFLSGHFLFAPGSFVQDVPYDESLYFIGEEISLSVRAFVAGYATFHPTRNVVFHEYTRAYREHKHWNDHQEGTVEAPWWERDQRSRASVASLLHNADLHGPGGTLADYEDFAGISFERRRAHPHTWMRREPPTPASRGWQHRGARYVFRVPFPLEWTELEHPDPCWTLEILDDGDRVLLRRVWWRAEFFKIHTDGFSAWFPVALDSETPPTHFTITRGYSVDEVLVAGEILAPPSRPVVTWVTALVDLGRDTLAHPRPFAEYRARLEELLRDGLPDDEIVVFCDPADFDWVRAARGDRPLRTLPLTRADIRSLPDDARIETLRADAAWRAQAEWLATSPQAALPGYVALVKHKFALLDDIAAELPDDAIVFWVDAGITRTVPARAVAGLAEQPPQDTLRFFAFPYPTHTREVHGFPRDAMHTLAGGVVEQVVRGGVFGGRADRVRSAARVFDSLRTQTLAAGLLGTEESLFSILARRGDTDFCGVVPIGDDGLLVPAPAGRAPTPVHLPARPDRIALARWAREWHAIDRRGAPAHALLRGPDAWAHAALIAPWLLRGDLMSIEPGPGGEAPAMAFVTAGDRARAMVSLAPMEAPEGVWRYVQTAEGRVPPPANTHASAAVYVLTFEAPQQLDVWAGSIEANCPELLDAPVRVLIDNSLSDQVAAANERWCRRWGFEHLRFNNVGITGGRFAATRHFVESTQAGQMWYFEDDMLITSDPGLCANGFRRACPDLFAVVTDIVAHEDDLDLLKLSFTEYFGCHQLDWAWINRTPEARAALGSGSATTFRSIRSSRGIPWALGDVHYSHWPSVLSRRGAERLLLAEPYTHDEASLMRWVGDAQREGSFAAGVLLASPIEHNRVATYAAEQRREWLGE